MRRDSIRLGINDRPGCNLLAANVVNRRSGNVLMDQQFRGHFGRSRKSLFSDFFYNIVSRHENHAAAFFPYARNRRMRSSQ